MELSQTASVRITSMSNVKIGVLALQGDFAEHIAALKRLDVDAVEVRLPRDLDGLDGLIIPGGESTTISKLLKAFDLLEPLRERVRQGLPLMGTCAGAIVMAKEAIGLYEENLGLMDIAVRRNAFGRQVDSFEADLDIEALGDLPFHAVFIRAPVIEGAGDGVEVLSRLADGTIVAVRQGRLLALAFHPELTADPRFHAYFLRMAEQGTVPSQGAATRSGDPARS